ncbi:MAG: AarF/ABC1/UbiB kinase family protein [Symploca sp. SIO1B1]|nr:AarF/ABC1/UbiB kinase family protein [Symploca sp. SIO1B1]
MLTTTTNQLLRWQRVQYSPLARQIDIFGSAAKFAFDLWWDKLTGNNSPKQRNRRARWLVNSLLDLGPTFIKLGQALSTRADLLPLEYIQALVELQDQIPAGSEQEAIALIEAEIGGSIHSWYRDFDSSPLASASLGQVYKARLHTGEEVVVKVQRPGLEGLFNLDFEVLHRLMRWGKRLLPGVKKYNLEAIYQQFFELLYQEIDYIHEGKNADRFRQNFSGYSQVVVPVVFWQYTTKKILTLEYVPGIKIDDRQTLEAAGLNIKNIIQLGICSYLKQLLQDGFFQSDPHPGNMAVSREGKLIFYDFGTMAEVKSIAKEQMLKTFFAVQRKDTDEVINTLIYMGLIEPIADMRPVRRLMAFILEQFLDKPIDVRAFEQMSSEIYELFKQQPFRLPAQMTFVLKSLTTLDGIARKLDPQYNLLAASQPFVKSLTVSLARGNIVGELARQVRDFVKYKWDQPSATERLIQRLEERIEQGELQLRVRSLESELALQRINLGIKSLIYACLTGFTLLSGTVLLLSPYSSWAVVAFGLSGLWILFLLRSLINLAVREKIDRLV